MSEEGNISPKSNVLRFGFGGLCFLVAIIMFAYQEYQAMVGQSTSWIGGLLWLIVTVTLAVLGIRTWNRTAEAHWIIRTLLSLVIAGIAILGGYGPIRRQYIVEHQQASASPQLIPVASTPFSVQVEYIFDLEKPPAFYIRNSSILCIASTGLFMNVNNLQTWPSMIADFKVETMDSKTGNWVALPHVHVTKDMQLYIGSPYFGLSGNHAGRATTEILEQQFEGLTLQPHIPIQGWMFFTNPMPYPVTAVRVRITDSLGVGYTTSPLIPTRGNSQDISFLAGEIIDLGKFKTYTDCGDL